MKAWWALGGAVVLLAGCDRAQEAAPPAGDREAAPAVVASPAASASPVDAPRGPFAPRDECTGPREAAFSRELQRIVAARDLERLMALTDPQVQLGFGGEDGADNMRRDFAAPDGGMWQELAEVVRMGCTVDQWGNLVMPWYFAQDTGGDPFETMLVTGNDVALRAAGQANARQLASVSWDIVDLVPETDAKGLTTFGGPAGSLWVKVRTRGEAQVTGFMRESDLRSVIDYRLIADKSDGPYRISAFLAGD